MTTTQNNEKEIICCKLCRPNFIERKAGLDNCRHSLCGCHATPSKPQEEKKECEHKNTGNCMACYNKAIVPSSNDWKDEEREKFYELANKNAWGACFECCDFEKMCEKTADYWLSRIQSRIDKAKRKGFIIGRELGRQETLKMTIQSR